MWEQPIPASFETLTALTSRDVQFHVRSDRPDGRPARYRRNTTPPHLSS